MPVQPQQKLPTLESLENPRAALELYAAFQRLYEYVDFIKTQLENRLVAQIKNGQLTPDNLNSLIGVFSQPLAGSNSSDPLLQTILQNFGSQAANLVLASPNGAAGSPIFRALASSDIPNLDAAKITSGALALARLDTKIVYTNDNFNKVVAGAPYINDGYIELTKNSGGTIKLMTTA